MAVNTSAFLVVNPDPAQMQSALIPEPAPTWLWGQGTPDGDRVPFSTAQKGTLYSQTDAADDESALWLKVDEGSDDADWVRLGGVSYARSKTFNIDNGSGTTDDDIILVPDRAIVVLAARAIYTVATDTAGAASANFKLGTAVAGAEIVAATALEVSKAVGTYTAGTIVAGAVAANGMVAVRHTGIAATEAGEYFVQIAYA